MNTKDIEKQIEKVMDYLADIDCYDIAKMSNNAKKLHKAYDTLDILKERIGGTNE